MSPTVAAACCAVLQASAVLGVTAESLWSRPRWWAIALAAGVGVVLLVGRDVPGGAVLIGAAAAAVLLRPSGRAS